MARTPLWETLPMAQGDSHPAWPLPSVVPKFATWSLGGGRPYGCTEKTCERWHAGIDLTGAPDSAPILAPEDALVVGIDRGWSEGAKAAFLRTDSGLFLVLGGFKSGSHREYGVAAGQRVKKGDKLGRVLGSYGMIHLETYAAGSRTANSVWWKSEPPPEGLLNPTNYAERMVGDTVSLVQTRQRHEALRALGYYKGDVDAGWSSVSTEALRVAQKALGVEADGKWGPKTEDAIQRALAGLEIQQGCTRDECAHADDPASPEAAPVPTSATDVLAGPGRLGWLVGGIAVAGVAVGAVLAVRSRST